MENEAAVIQAAPEPDLTVTVSCPCPDSPHENDTVTLRPKLGLRGGIVAEQSLLNAQANIAEVTAIIAEVFLRYGVAEWTFTNGTGEPIPVTYEAIDRVLLSDFALAQPIADRASDLYGESVFGPLARRAAAQKSSRPTPIGGSTSVKRVSSASRRKRSR